MIHREAGLYVLVRRVAVCRVFLRTKQSIKHQLGVALLCLASTRLVTIGAKGRAFF